MSKEINGVQMQTICTCCEQKFSIGKSNVAKEAYTDRHGQTIWGTYYVCPKCGARYYVQVDNAETNGLLVELGGLLKQIAKKKRNNKSAASKHPKYISITNKLQTIRERLADQYDGELLVNSCGIEFKMEIANGWKKSQTGLQ